MDEEVEIILQQDSVEVTEPLVGDYILPTATETTLGGIKVGDNLDIDSAGHLSVPVATNSSLGVVQAGTGIAISSEGVISATGEYELPQATKTTLGGVYVDDALNNSSQNPVQNAVVSLAIGQTNSDLSTLSTTVSGQGATLTTLGNTVGTLSTTVNTLSGTVTNQATTIGNNTSAISALSNRLDDAESDISDLDTGLGETSQHVGELMEEVNDTIAYTDVTGGTWTSGDITVIRRGLVGYLIINLEGSSAITIPANDTIELHDLDTELEQTTRAVLTDGAQVVEVELDTTGKLNLINSTASAITLDRITGNIPVIYG